MYLSLLIIDFQVVVKAGILGVFSFLMSDNNSMIHKALLKNNNIFVIFTKLIDQMRKWHPKKYYFVFVRNSLAILVSTDKIQKKSSFRQG